ncbi:hypothetical protein Rhe02_73120 [Rhizocola hellebori]|uniref:UvrD-like helicase ATP-binding domain-containing protein n=1 Tax=Rhizocola hellebori TaxID=1392758 RepID=A0A8J3QGF5_9ACTN|nr:UvrD-helicase domain-containing protein [Rhizocola hellebori]GIH09245.1 hypothetical protein Rhe02_73120 [Rhizocola hellebori]
MQSLRSYLEIGRTVGFEPFEEGAEYGPDLIAMAVETDVFLFHRNDDVNSRLIMVDGDSWSSVTSMCPNGQEDLLKRVDRAAWEIAHPPVSLPWNWSKYSFESLIAFFALPRYLNSDSMRWIAEAMPNGDACFWRLTHRGNELRLEDFHPRKHLAEAVRQRYTASLSAAAAQFPPELDAAEQLLQPTVDLGVIGFASVIGTHTYSMWLPKLTAAQRKVLDTTTTPIKIRGAAGTGKTLVMMLKVLQELYRDIDRKTSSVEGGMAHDEEKFKILFVTHSSSLATEVNQALDRLDERGVVSRHVDVVPFTFLRTLLQGEQSHGAEVFGEDSLDGKQRQLELISKAIDEVTATTWSTYEDNVSAWVRQSALADRRSDQRKSLCWSLMREFVEVIDANRLKPGVNSLRRYINLPRAEWMVNLKKQGDREFAFGIYRNYVEHLVQRNQLTIDQAMSDFLLFLESYLWNLRRKLEGYDFLFVDEFHLFNDVERLVLHLLTREPDEYPKIILATDPYQSPFAYVTGLRENELSHAVRDFIGAPQHLQLIDLRTNYRFAPMILNFVRHAHNRVPNIVDMGHDWQYEAITSDAASGGNMPVVCFSPEDSVITRALEYADSVARKVKGDSRVAVVCVTNSDLAAVVEPLRTGRGLKSRFEIVESRDDFYQLSISRRAVVVTAGPYAAGLQFSDVVVVFTAEGQAEFGGQGTSAKRAAITYLYLAITRAQTNLRIFSTSGENDLNDVLRTAVEDGVLQSS